MKCGGGSSPSTVPAACSGATVTKILPFGAFVDVAPGVPGLLALSATTPDLSVGTAVSVRIRNLDVENRRMSVELV